MLTVKDSGSFENIENLLQSIVRESYLKPLDNLALQGVDALSSETPVDTGRTAASWDYEIVKTNNSVIVAWYNDNVTDTGIPIALLIDYGHGTGTGQYVNGLHYIEPTINPYLDKIADAVWEEVRNS